MNYNEEVPGFLGGLGDVLPADVLKKVEVLLKQLLQADKEHQDSHYQFVYVAPGAQHVERQYIKTHPWPLPLGLIPSSSSITVVPDSNNGIFESKNYDISKTIFTKIIRAEQFFDITYTSLINNDTVSFKIPPSDLLLLDGEPILKDTITIAFPKLNNFE